MLGWGVSSDTCRHRVKNMIIWLNLHYKIQLRMLVFYNTFITIIFVIISSQWCNDITAKLFTSCQTTITRPPNELKCWQNCPFNGRFYNITRITYVPMFCYETWYIMNYWKFRIFMKGRQQLYGKTEYIKSFKLFKWLWLRVFNTTSINIL